MVHSSGAAIPHGDAAGQDALNDAAVEVAEDLRRHARFPQPTQEVQPLLRPLNQLCGVEWPGEVLTDVHPLHFKPPDEQWLLRSPLFPHVHYLLLRLVCVEVVVLTPRQQTGHFPPVGRFVSAGDASYH